MSMFLCDRCDEMRDADDGCDEAPGNPFGLICIECMDELEAEAEEAETFHQANPLEPDYRKLA